MWRALLIASGALALSLGGIAGALRSDVIVNKINVPGVQRLEPQNFYVHDEIENKDVLISVNPVIFRAQAIAKFREGVAQGCNPLWAGLSICSPVMPGDYVLTPDKFVYVSLCPDTSDGFFSPYIMQQYSTTGNMARVPSSGCAEHSYMSRVFGSIVLVGPNDPAWMPADVRFARGVGGAATVSPDEYNAGVGSVIYGGVSYDKPSVDELVRSYGVTVGDSYTDEGWKPDPEPIDPTDPTDPTEPAPVPGGVPTTCTTASGSTTTNQFECAPTNDETKCSVLDIPCNLKKLFVPDPDFFGKLFDADKVSHQLELPVVITNTWDFQLLGERVSFDWRTIVIPDLVKDMIIGVLYVRQGFWVMSFLGMPLPFGSPSGGGAIPGQIGDAVRGSSGFQSFRRRVGAAAARRSR